MDKTGMDKKGMDKTGMDKTGMDKKGMDKKGMDKTGMDEMGMDKTGMDKSTMMFYLYVQCMSSLSSRKDEPDGIEVSKYQYLKSKSKSAGSPFIRQNTNPLLLATRLTLTTAPPTLSPH